MFVRIKNLRVNMDNVTNYWFEDKQEEWHIKDVIDIKHRYFLNIEYVGQKEPEHIEFSTREQWDSAATMLDSITKPLDIYAVRE